MPEEIVSLAIDGMVYSGWTGVRITRAIDTLSGEFELELVDRERTGAARLDIRAGAACEVRIGDETVITGWVDRVSPQMDAQSHSISVSGRDKAADLIDCSAVAKPGSWTNTALETIAVALAAPFGIRVTAKASTKPTIRRFAIQQGETVQSAIERLCRYRGLLAVSTRNGDVELITPDQGEPVATLIEGANLLMLAAMHDVSDRFSDYILKGQASGSDDLNGKAASAPSATAKDPAIARYRPLVVIGEEQSDIASLEKRAKWEAIVRAARAQEATVHVLGWRQSAGGALWDRNVIAHLKAPSLFMDAPMLVTVAVLAKDERGTVTELRLSPPKAWSQLPVPEDAEASRVGAAA